MDFDHKSMGGGNAPALINEKFQWACQLLKEATEENRAVREQFEELLLETDRLKLQLE